MVAYQKSYEKKTSCGGWIPWMVCPQTHHRTEFHSVEVPETITLTDCCEGYEQVGLYCSLALNRSSVFASRPGICPVKDMETFDYPCTFDTECPGLKKCCSSSKGAGCVDPMPEGRVFWYNVTVLVKMDFSELIRVDSHLLNHSRLLHSMITGALQPLNVSVHHVQSNRGDIYAGTVASQLLLGLQHPAPLAEVSSSLKAMAKRVYEVIDTQVQDVNECSYAEFNACPEKSSCVNLEGYYSCHPQHGHATVTPHWLSPRKEGMVASTPTSVNAVNTGSSSPFIRKSSLLSITNQSTDAECYPSAVTNHRILSVTSNSFEMSWLVSSTLNHTFHVRVAKGNETVQNLRTEEMQVDVSHLEAGVMYSVEISYETCGKTIISHQNVKTEAKLFDVTMRILNYNFTDDFHNSSSSAYEEFSRILLTELENSFPPNISALYKSGKLKVQIESLAAGSIIVRLRITVQDPEFPVDASTFAPVLSYLHNGSVLEVDQQNTAVEDWDECASQADNDCSVFAECINLMGSYMCRCKTTMDTNPSRPGRNCEGEIVDPLTETVAPEIKTSMDLAPEEGRSPAGPAPTATMGTAAAAGPTSGATTLLPAALALGDKRASHNPTSAPPTPWQKGLSPQMALSRTSSPVAMEVTPSRALPVGTAAAAGPGSGAATFLPAMLALGDKRVSHNPTSAPPTPWQKGLFPQMALSRTSSPVAMGVTPSRALPMGTAAAAGPTSGAATLLPAALALGDKRASHNPTSAPPTPWQKGLSPQMAFSRDSSPVAMGVSASRALPMGTAVAAGPMSGAATFLPAMLALGDKRVSHSPTSAPPTPWQKGLSPQMALSRTSSPVAMGVTPSRALPMGTVAAAGLASGAATLLPAALALSDKRASHNPSSAPPTPWQKGLFPQMALSRTSSPVAMGITPSRALPMGTAAAAGPMSGAATFLPAALALSDKRASHNPSSAPPMSWQKAFQKLSGTVRITNTEYSPGFNNNSSEENQTFAQLFVAEVQKSLPLEVLQQMDAGLIQVLVTGVTNGSTVVSFNLLLAEEVDAHRVISTFCEALEHSSHFTMDRSSLSTHALPFSQKATVTDKKPVNSAVLPVTSLQTSAHVSSLASLDFSPAEHKALEDPMFSSTVLSPLTMDPMAAPDVSPQAPPAPLVKPAQEVSIKDAVSVFCEIDRIVLAIQKRFLQQESIPESSLFLGEPGCNVSTSNGTHVVLQAGWSDCGTQVETNMTTTVVRTTLRNDVSTQGIIHHLNIASPIHCVFQNDVLTSSGFTAERLYTIFEDLHGPGYFRTEMQLFIGSSPVPRNFSVSASEDVLMEVGMQRADSQLKVVLTDCWATPTNNSVDPLPFVFISNSCPIPNTYTTLVENGNSSKAQFKMKIFSLVNNSVVYLHCRIRICVESPGSTCRTRCHARTRLLKAGETISLHRTSWGPLWKSAASDSKREKEAGVRIGSIILIALAVLGFVLGVATLLIFQYQRKTGRCNLRIKSDNFSYQVFYD
ncbi:uromodulin-like 1 [Passerculus sandwichensis]